MRGRCSLKITLAPEGAEASLEGNYQCEHSNERACWRRGSALLPPVRDVRLLPHLILKGVMSWGSQNHQQLCDCQHGPPVFLALSGIFPSGIWEHGPMLLGACKGPVSAPKYHHMTGLLSE